MYGVLPCETQDGPAGQDQPVLAAEVGLAALAPAVPGVAVALDGDAGLRVGQVDPGDEKARGQPDLVLDDGLGDTRADK